MTCCCFLGPNLWLPMSAEPFSQGRFRQLLTLHSGHVPWEGRIWNFDYGTPGLCECRCLSLVLNTVCYLQWAGGIKSIFQYLFFRGEMHSNLQSGKLSFWCCVICSIGLYVVKHHLDRFYQTTFRDVYTCCTKSCTFNFNGVAWTASILVLDFRALRQSHFRYYHISSNIFQMIRPDDFILFDLKWLWQILYLVLFQFYII